MPTDAVHRGAGSQPRPGSHGVGADGVSPADSDSHPPAEPVAGPLRPGRTGWNASDTDGPRTAPGARSFPTADGTRQTAAPGPG